MFDILFFKTDIAVCAEARAFIIVFLGVVQHNQGLPVYLQLVNPYSQLVAHFTVRNTATVIKNI